MTQRFYSKVFTQEKENLCSQKNLFTNVFGGFIHNCPKWETTQISFNWQIDKETVVYPYNGILLRNKKNKLLR